MPRIKIPLKAKLPAITAPAVGWGPAAAVLVTVVLYFLSQILGSVVMLFIANLQHISRGQVTDWLQQAGPQFFYIFVVEAITLALLYLFIRHRKTSIKKLGLTRPHWSDAVHSLIGFGVYFPVLIAGMALARQWFPGVNWNQQQQVGFEAAHGAALVLVFISLVILPPITEEILARGFLYSGLKTKLPIIWAALVTSLIFASAHLQFGSGTPLLWAAAIDTFILSLVLVWLREKTGRLWASVGLHMLKNTLAFLVLFIFTK